MDFSLCHGSHPLTRLPLPVTQTDGSSVTTTRTPHPDPQPKDITNKKFDINSPFALLKSGGEPGSIDVYTPDNCPWIAPSLPVAPQKQNPGFKTVKKICLMSQNKGEDTPQGRASFGVFPLEDQVQKVSCFKTPSMIGAQDEDMKQTENVVRAPRRDASKRHATRRGQQPSTHTTSTRSGVIRGQIFSQSGNFNQDHSPSNNNSNNNNSNTTNNQTTEGNHLRRSTRLFGLSSVKENSKNTSRNQENSNKTSGSNKTPPKKQRRHTSSTVTSATITQSKDKNDSGDDLKSEVIKPTVNQADLIQAAIQIERTSAEGLMNLLKHFGKGQALMGQYKMEEAIKVLKSLPEKHSKSGWVLSSLAKCYFEQAKYTEAIKLYEESREIDPHRLEGCEYYSTALWHLQQEVKLSALSQELIELDKNSPQTWCAAGNCFSLQKEHETSIKFLQRAIQVDPDFAYAYTLLGHELVLTEEMDHAASAFRNAIRIDPRHYNAWFGLAMICCKQEKYSVAEIHYKKAIEICPSNPTLRCHLGVVTHALKKSLQALDILNESIRMDPKNALSRYHRACIYFAIDRHEDALRELEHLKILAPKESLVYFVTGKVSSLSCLSNIVTIFAFI
jgi:anaphase-promoting complex subunit 3